MLFPKRYSILLLFAVQVGAAQAQQLHQQLKERFGTDNVIAKDSSAFKEYYEIRFWQPIDHQDTSKGFFTQRLFLGHNDANKPMIIETNGYELLPYQGLQYVAEPVTILSGNQLIVEHMYYGQSMPAGNDLKFLNFKQISADYHHIKNQFSDIYKAEWISTGASKGGLTALSYSFYYPKDIQASFAYVAPTLDALEDKRITHFLQQKRSTAEGKKIFEIQQHLLDKKALFLPIFLDILKFSDLDIGKLDPETLYDFAVLEFDFNYWQYISDFDKQLRLNRRELDRMKQKGLQAEGILVSQNDSMIAAFPMCVWFFMDKKLSVPFFYQCFNQMGSYGYEEQLFKGLKNKSYSLAFLAEQEPVYSKKYVRSFNKFLKKRLRNTILIYGGDDPWTACKATIGSKTDNILVVNPGTNHATQIKDLSAAEKDKIRLKLQQWLKSEPILN